MMVAFSVFRLESKEMVVSDIRNLSRPEPELKRDNTRINEKIRVHELRLIGPDGKQLGVMSPDKAMEIAREHDMDLVEIAPQARPPVCRIMDYGKFRYEKTRKEREARRHQRLTTLKEVKFRPKIDAHDFNVKVKSIEKFINHGDKVKITVMFRGRERSHTDLGFDLTARIAESSQEYAFVEAPAKMEGRNMYMVLAPLKKDSKGDKAVKSDGTGKSDGAGKSDGTDKAVRNNGTAKVGKTDQTDKEEKGKNKPANDGPLVNDIGAKPQEP